MNNITNKEDSLILTDTLDSTLKSLGGSDMNDELLKILASLISMPDEQFEIIAPNILQTFLMSINNPNEKMVLVQSLNASGGKAEDLILILNSFNEEIDKITTISNSKKDFLKMMIGGICNAISETEGIAKRIIQVPIELCHPDAKMPQYAHESDSGMDVFALDDYTIGPGETKLIPTGIKMAVPVGYEIQVRPKSGRALKTKLRVANTPGTIDSGYRDEICVIVENVTAPIKQIHYEFNEDGTPRILAIDHGESYSIGKGEKFAQLVLMEVPKAALLKVDSILEIGDNRGGGFGSSGLK